MNKHPKKTPLWLVALLGVALQPAILPAAPAWWGMRGVVITNASNVNDYAAANIGQLKWFATNACDELEQKLPGGAGTSVWQVVRNFAGTNQTALVNLGQVKYVATPFYNRLIQTGYATNYPWINIPFTNDYACANLGQIKYVFSFEIQASTNPDTDADGLPDAWEIAYFGGITTQTGTGDADGDGLTNLQEYQRGTDPNNAASRSITLYVNGGTGSNAYDGQSADWDGTHGPKQNVDSALSVALGGDTIMIQAGTYQEGSLWTLGPRNIRLVPMGAVVIQ